MKKTKPINCLDCFFYCSDPDIGYNFCHINGRYHGDLYNGDDFNRPSNCPLDLSEKDFVKLNMDNLAYDDIIESFEYINISNRSKKVLISHISKLKFPRDDGSLDF